MSTLPPRSVDPNNVRGADLQMQSMDCKRRHHGSRSARSPQSARSPRMLGLVDEKPNGFALTELKREGYLFGMETPHYAIPFPFEAGACTSIEVCGATRA